MSNYLLLPHLVQKQVLGHYITQQRSPQPLLHIHCINNQCINSCKNMSHDGSVQDIHTKPWLIQGEMWRHTQIHPINPVLCCVLPIVPQEALHRRSVHLALMYKKFIHLTCSQRQRQRQGKENGSFQAQLTSFPNVATCRRPGEQTLEIDIHLVSATCFHFISPWLLVKWLAHAEKLTKDCDKQTHPLFPNMCAIHITDLTTF